MKTISVGLLSLVAALTGFADEPIDYDYVDFEYSIDSTIEIEGGSYDSDDKYAIGASWLFMPRLFVIARYSSAGYDLASKDGFFLDFATLGVGYRHPIREDETPTDFVVQVNLEYNETNLETTLGTNTIESEGWGLRAGFRSKVAPSLELGAFAYYFAFGSLPTHDNLDGLSFELTSTLELTDRFGIALTYSTGELDYLLLEKIPEPVSPVQVEVDRDDLALALRVTF